MPCLSFVSRISKWWKLILTVLAALLWIFLWFFPWIERLHHIFWLQLGAGLAVFIIPGFCTFGLLNNHPGVEFNHVTFGFVISHLIFALLGLMGRLIHLSFETIVFLMMAYGFVVLIIYILLKVDYDVKFQVYQGRLTYFLSILPFLIICLMVSMIVVQRTLTDDDLSYLAFLNNWQYSTHLDFNDLIFDTSQLVQPRFWLMSAPFAQAFLAEISKVPGILILSGYYEPFLVIISAFCWYELALELKLSPKAASASVVLQLSFLLLLSEYLHPGSPYFNQLSSDKATAAFILVPVFFQSLIKLLDSSTWKHKLLFLLTGLSLTFMHPIIVAYAAFIAGVLVLFNKSNQGLRNKVVPIAILIIILIPQVLIRFAKVPAMQATSFEAETVLNQSGSNTLVTQWGDTRYYGFNANILAMKMPYKANIPLPELILKWSWLLIPVIAVIFAVKQLNDPIAQFIVAGFLLCFLTGFPFTGWIFGYFLNARMLARSVWLFPYGISAAYLLLNIGNRFWNRPDTKRVRLRTSTWSLIILTLFSMTLFFLFFRENKLPDFEKFSLKSIRYQGFSTAGQVLDHLIADHAVVAGSENLNDFIPGVSWKAQIVTFRVSEPSNMFYFSSTERTERIADAQVLFSKTASPEDRLLLIRKYNIHYLVLQRGDLKLFNDLITNYPGLIKATEIGGVYIVEIN